MKTAEQFLLEHFLTDFQSRLEYDKRTKWGYLYFWVTEGREESFLFNAEEYLKSRYKAEGGSWENSTLNPVNWNWDEDIDHKEVLAWLLSQEDKFLFAETHEEGVSAVFNRSVIEIGFEELYEFIESEGLNKFTEDSFCPSEHDGHKQTSCVVCPTEVDITDELIKQYLGL